MWAASPSATRPRWKNNLDSLSPTLYSEPHPFMKTSRASLVAQFAIPRIRNPRREPETASVPADRTSGVVSLRLGGGCRPSGVDSLPSGTPALSSGVNSLSSVPPSLTSGVASRRLGFSRRKLRFSSQPSLNSLKISKLPSPGLAATLAHRMGEGRGEGLLQPSTLNHPLNHGQRLHSHL